jgi:hypothetical protein
MELYSQQKSVSDSATRSGWDGEANQDEATRLPSLFHSSRSSGGGGGSDGGGYVRGTNYPFDQTSSSSFRRRDVRPDPGPAPTKKTEPVAAPTEKPTPEGCRDLLLDDSATVNMAAMLLAVSRWKPTSFPHHGWKLANPSHQEGLLPLLTDDTMVTTIDKMLVTNNSNRKPVLLVAASDNFADIRRRISTWPDFDLAALEKVHNAGPSITTCAQLQLQSDGWPRHLSKKGSTGGRYSQPLTDPVTGWAKEGGVGGETLKFPNLDQDEAETRSGSRMERDGRGLVMGTYQLSIGGLLVEVRTTHLASSYQTPVNLQSLVTEHANGQDSFTPIPSSEMCGYEFHAVKCSGNTRSIRPIQGATNNTAQVVAIQAITNLQINKRTPLNLTARTVAVVRDRGWNEPDRSTPYQMYETLAGETWFNNLVEVLVDGQLVFATMTQTSDTKYADA